MENNNPEEQSPTTDATADKKKSFKRRFLRGFLLILALLLIAGGIIGYYAYTQLFQPNVPSFEEERYVEIPRGTNLYELADLLKEEGLLEDEGSFIWLAEQMDFEGRSGRFKIEENWSNLDLIRTLRSGKQAPVKLTFHNLRLKEQLAGHVAQFIEADSLSIAKLMNDTAFLAAFNHRPETVMAMFIPNTYELFWNTSAEDFMKRMYKEHQKFWTEDRLEKARELGLNTTQVYTLASIVETETQANSEKARIAGVYLNRLRTKGWKLEADPTVVFAIGDFSLRRVLKSHLEVDSKYNTYKYPGLPPGPIYMASISSIDKTLEAENHDYMFFCARPDKSGTHAFAKSFSGHQANARRYHRWLREQNIK